MCGIAGTVCLDGALAEPKLLETMANALVHRGPDGAGIHCDGSFGLAHRRLSIIDLAGGAQPLTNEDGSVWTVFNGEIYNFKELRRELEAKGHVFKTASDTETIVHLYEQEGADFPKRLQGMFAIAVLDAKKRKLFLVRDRLGKKPLVYFRNGPSFAFASELAALKLHPAMPRELDRQALWDYLTLLYVPSPRSIFQGVSKLPPGQILELDFLSGFINTSKYWEPDFSRKLDIDYDSAKDQLRKLLEDAVKLRMVADVPLGAFLSGGLDSTIIAGLMCRLSGAPVKTFTIGFADPAYDERKLVGRTLSHLKGLAKAPLESTLREVEPQDFALLEKLAVHFGEPFADSSMLPTYLVSKFARESVTVALSGDGADEVFCGYERYLAMKLAGLADFLPQALRDKVFGTLANLIPQAAGERTPKGRARRFLKALAAEPSRRYLDLLSRFDETLKRSVAGPVFDSFTPGETHDYFKLALGTASSADPVERLMEADLDCYLPGDILPKLDICSMAASLEMRSPFLDYRVVEFAASLPRNFKQTGRVRKRILLDAFKDLLPPDMGRRPKRGFGVPMASWLRGAWLPLLKGRLLEGRALENGILNRGALEGLLQEHASGKADRSYALFSLLMLELFLDA